MSPVEIALIVLLGAFCALDTVSVGQVMIARPLCSATFAGALLGRPLDGLVAGAVLELIALETMPFGASRYPEWGSAGVTAGTVVALGGAERPGALAVALFAGLLTAALGSASMVLHRRVVAAAAASLRDHVAAGSARAVSRVHAFGIASDVARGIGVMVLAMAGVGVIAIPILRDWRMPYGPSVAVPVCVAAAVGVAALLRMSGGTTRAIAIATAGAALAGALLVVTG
ncbi:MAG: PTS sugar transporter subunit IIC [Gemmatimonadetes bacterium]|nr:PTS sugar transporter subunit IIC [Gemmatimonadota bacterium]